MGIIFIVAVSLIFSWVFSRYLKRTDYNRDLQEFQKKFLPTRPLTEKELTRLAPLLKSEQLIISSPQVYTVVGNIFTRHRIKRPSQTYLCIDDPQHKNIKPIELLPPYESLVLSQKKNQVSFVCTQTAALIIDVNGQSTLWPQGEKQKLGWFLPDALVIRDDEHPYTDSGLQLRPPDTDNDTVPPNSSTLEKQAQILSQREETINEVMDRLEPDYKKKSFYYWGAAASLFYFCSWGLGGNLMQTLILLLVGVVLALFGLFTWIQKKPYDRFKTSITSYQGLLTFRVADRGVIGKMMPMFHIDDHVPIKIPPRWENHCKLWIGKKICAQVRDQDHSVVDLGHGWSLEAEHRLMKRSIWEPYFLLLIFGLALWLLNTTFPKSLFDGYQHLDTYMNNGVRHYAAVEEIFAAPPEKNTLFTMQGQGHCLYTLKNQNTRKPTNPLLIVDCQTIQWGEPWLGEDFSILLPPSFKPLYDGSLIHSIKQTVVNPAYQEATELRIPYWQRQHIIPTVSQANVTDFDVTISIIENACRQGLENCAKLKDKWMALLAEESLFNGLTWEALAQNISTDEALKNFATLYAGMPQALQQLAYNAVAEHISHQRNKLNQHIVDRQNNTLHISIVNDENAPLLFMEQSMPEPQKEFWEVTQDTQKLFEWMDRYQSLPFALEGVIKEVARDKNNHPLFIIEQQKNEAQALAAVSRGVQFLFSILLMAVGAYFFCTRFIQSMNRNALLDRYYKDLPHPQEKKYQQET